MCYFLSVLLLFSHAYPAIADPLKVIVLSLGGFEISTISNISNIVSRAAPPARSDTPPNANPRNIL